MKIYLAGAISNIDWSEATTWRDDIIEYFHELYKVSPSVFNPCDYFNDDMTEKEAMEFDLYHLRQSNLMIVNWNYDSIGTAIEIGVAKERGIPIFILNDTDKELHPWIDNSGVKVFNTLYDLLSYIETYYLDNVNYNEE